MKKAETKRIYLLNGSIYEGCDVPVNDAVKFNYYSEFKKAYNMWLKKLVQIYCSESEIEKIKNKVYTFNNCVADNPIDVTDVTELEEIKTQTKSGGWTDYRIIFREKIRNNSEVKKVFIVADIRKLLTEMNNGDISFSRMVEIMNEMAFEKYSK